MLFPWQQLELFGDCFLPGLGFIYLFVCYFFFTTRVFPKIKPGLRFFFFEPKDPLGLMLGGCLFVQQAGSTRVRGRMTFDTNSGARPAHGVETQSFEACPRDAGGPPSWPGPPEK